MYRLALAAALCLAAACKKVPDEPVADPRAYAIEALVGDGRDCLEGERAYCLDDPALVGAVLDECVQEKAKGEALPKTKRALDAFARRCGFMYRDAQFGTPERRAAVKALVWAQFLEPEATVAKGAVYADAGDVPRALRQHRGRTYELAGSGERTQNGFLEPAEVARQLRRLRAAHPDAKRLVLRVRMPRGGRASREHFYTWLAPEARVTVVRGGDRWMVEAAADETLSALSEGDAPLHRRMTSCSGQRVPAACPKWWPSKARFAAAKG